MTRSGFQSPLWDLIPWCEIHSLWFIPERGGALKCYWIATVLTAQVAAGAGFGIAAQVILPWVIIGHVMPSFGKELLDMARGVADFGGGSAFWGRLVASASSRSRWNRILTSDRTKV
jgi:hypothetical protein